MPVKAREVNLNEVTRLAGLGLSQAQVGAALGMSRSAVQARLGTGNGEVDEAFKSAYELGQATLAQEIGALLLGAARSGSVESMRFIAQSRLNWKPTAKLESEIMLEASPSINIILTSTIEAATPALLA